MAEYPGYQGQLEDQEWPALSCSSEVLSIAGSRSISHDFELLSNYGASEDSFSLVSAEGSDGWHRLEIDSDDQSDVSDLDDGRSSYLKKALAPSRSGTAGQPVEPIRRRPYTKRKNSTKKTFATLDAVMEEDGFEKAMADIMVTKKEGKFRGLDGHTGRKGCGCSNCREQLRAPPELSRTHEARRTPVPRFGYLADAIEKDEFGTPMSRLQEPYSITAFELNGGDTSYSLERSNAWWELPALLEEHSVAAPQQRTLANGSLETSYLLEPVGEFLPSTVVASAQHQLKYHIHQIQRHKPKLWVKLATDPPEGVSAPQLKTLLRCRASKVPQEAVVRCNNCASAWDVASAFGHSLDIDLGATCDVAHFSTQGRHPPTRTYPHIWTDPDTKQRHIEDEDYNMFNVRPGGRYQGPWWTVKCEKHDRHHFKYNIKWMPEQWVSKYELWARGEQQGSAWSLLGVFSGNDDATTEVAHSFAHMRGGLRARYLRVRPLENVGGGALRVGVYGRVVPPPKDKSTILKAVRLARGKATVGDASDVITYTLTTGQVAGVGRENRNTRFARDRNSTSLCFSGGPYRHDWGSIHFATEAISARRQARQEAKEFTWGLHDLDDDVSTLAEMSRDPTCDYEYEMVYAPRPPVPLPVSRRSPLVVPASRNGWDAEREARCRAEVEWREPRKMTLLECVAHSPRQDCVGSFAWVPVQSVETDSGDDSRSRCL